MAAQGNNYIEVFQGGREEDLLTLRLRWGIRHPMTRHWLSDPNLWSRFEKASARFSRITLIITLSRMFYTLSSCRNLSPCQSPLRRLALAVFLGIHRERNFQDFAGLSWMPLSLRTAIEAYLRYKRWTSPPRIPWMCRAKWVVEQGEKPHSPLTGMETRLL